MHQGKTAAARRSSWSARLLALAVLLAGAALWSAPALGADGPPLKGQFADRFEMPDQPRPAPEVTFKTRDGETVRLADFKGQVVLLNFWATWCAPCVEEMPTLDGLQHALGGEAFQVLAVSQERGGLSTVEPFLREELNLRDLDIYLDSDGALAQAFGLRGLPTTYLLNARGQVVGGLEGAADWNSDAARALMQHYIDQGREAGVIETGG
ncbi:TlpA family protein disulfide reductase [Rhodovibrio salinarum]|uniref:TlpA family protein disulfide reductase n=1 Tax=Rhodovibrio salinarum TaxID=1087 RepID=A0A934QHV4_9PROT|nr:TlpA disulfide reductase family protein [Rhodovibrio salinarum]MBK1697083.1 TlpA family protein disulfide reductase [Rhodovibrio salinarum]